MQSIIHFKDKNFDVDRLVAEYRYLENKDWHEHFSGYDPEWKAIPLVSYNGATDVDSNKLLVDDVLSSSVRHYKKTVYLKKCKYINQILDEFKCPKLRVRLMKMGPGAVIPEHSDIEGWVRGIARLHIPIITHDKVYFFVDGKRAKMMEGELWYLDVTKTHSVANDSDITRVHLVIDLAVNQFVKDMFPRETAKDQFENFFHRRKAHLFSLARLFGFTRAFKKLRTRT